MKITELTRKQLTIAICFALAFVTLAVYCPVLGHDFINYDDPDYLLSNPHVKAGLTWPGIVWAFQLNAYAANWHPLTWISHMIDCELFGLNHPGAHHFVNVLFHAANAMLLFILLNNLTAAMWRSAVVAALFAWHPLHVESVAWASERKDVLSGFFWMLTLLVYARFAKSEKPNPPLLSFLPSPLYWLALFLFACGLMSKPMVVTLPCVLLLLDLWPLQRLSPKTLLRLFVEKIPFFALALGSCLMTLVVQNNARWSSANLPFDFRLANAFMSYVRYLSKIFHPANLALIYPYPHSWPIIGVAIAVGVIALLSFVFIFMMKRFPYLVVGWFWFLGTLVPTIGLIQVGVQSMADRYTYLPSIGIFILTIWGVGDLLKVSARKTELCILAGSVTLIGCLVLTSLQLRYWQNSVTIFGHSYLVTTDNYAVDDCLGVTLYTQHKFQTAQQLFEQAISLEPTYPMAQFDLGMDLLAQRDFNGASNHIATAVQLYPANPDMQYDFGIFLWQHGNSKDAVTHLNSALSIRPNFSQAREKLDEIEANLPVSR